SQNEKPAEKAFLTGHFVLFAPFKLGDPNTSLVRLKDRQLENGMNVYAIEATYDPDSYANHSTDDTWTYFFEKETGHFAGYLVHHPPTYAFIQNTEVITSGEMTWPAHRKSYRSDPDLTKTYLRGEFWYSDYKIIYKSDGE
ncbi:MAG: hypothetical protein AAFR14_07785, partial [Bacteroidota bacterium]